MLVIFTRMTHMHRNKPVALSARAALPKLSKVCNIKICKHSPVLIKTTRVSDKYDNNQSAKDWLGFRVS
jgi:hypothetical protein